MEKKLEGIHQSVLQLFTEEKIMSLQMHLIKSGSGMGVRTACGRNILRTPLAANWADFKNLPEDQKCAKCAASKQAALNAKHNP